MPGPRPQIGKLLFESGLVRENQIEFALTEQKATGERLGDCLLRIGFVSDSDLARVIAEQAGRPFVDLMAFTPDMELLKRIPAAVARQQCVLPIMMKDGRLHIAVHDPYDPLPAETVFRITGLAPTIHVAGRNILKRLVEQFYYLLENPPERYIEDAIARLRIDQGADIDANRILDILLAAAVSHRTTDIHLTPSSLSSRIILRIDGVLSPAHVFPLALHNRLVSTIKIRSGMDIAEQRRPQDGRMGFEFLGSVYDIRVSTVLTNHGENVVMRILPSRGTDHVTIRDLGFEGSQLDTIRSLFARPDGMVLITGPTGSGKTTTLYAALKEQDAIGKNITTVEDPIEYEYSMIRQTQVNEKAGYTFASAIRTFLRQDPDVILVGEIRDEETASLAATAALTGHLVLSTLHTTTAIGAIARLKDLNVSPFILASTLAGVISQRLIRKLCPFCKKPYSPSREILERYGLSPDGNYFKAGGCPECQGKGYLGRSAICEVFKVSKEVARLIADDVPLWHIEDRLRAEGFTDLTASGLRMVARGETSIEEFMRVVG
ncbi:MAG: GspE/PulE family protein [Deltaproteobacteria bacterium]